MQASPPPSRLHELEAAVASLLQAVAVRTRPADDAMLAELDHLSSDAGKLAYGSGHPEWVSSQMRYLISWCDHLDDLSCVAQFRKALSHEPLSAPPWSSEHE